MKSPTNEGQLGVLDRVLSGTGGLLRRGRCKDFEVTPTSQRNKRVLCASSWMFPTSLWSNAGPRFELSHAAIQIVDAENHMIDVHGSALLHREQAQYTG